MVAIDSGATGLLFESQDNTPILDAIVKDCIIIIISFFLFLLSLFFSFSLLIHLSLLFLFLYYYSISG